MIDNVDFTFPTWGEFSSANQVYLNKKEYKGHSVQLRITDMLYMLIECRNDRCLWNAADNIIHFAWCNRAGFAIAQAEYKYCEAGYIAGCVFLVNSANELSKFFSSFATKHASLLRARINKYNEEHPE